MLAGFGPNNPFVKPDNVYNAVSKMVESAGLKTPSLYFTKPDPEEVQKLIDAAENPPNPEEIKHKGAMELEQVKVQGTVQVEQAKLQADTQKTQLQVQAARDKEDAQMQADLQTNAAQVQAKTQEKAEQIQADALKDQRRINAEQVRYEGDLAFKYAKLEQERELKLLDIASKSIPNEPPAIGGEA